MRTTARKKVKAPFDGFARCHERILANLGALEALPALLEPAARARQLAAQSLDFFEITVFAHHRDEEGELFRAVLDSAAPGAERERVVACVDRLVREHRRIEALCKRLKKGLGQAAKGRDADLDPEDLQRLVGEYTAHARYEEEEFLPLCERILARDSRQLAALGLSIHLRHAKPRRSYL